MGRPTATARTAALLAACLAAGQAAAQCLAEPARLVRDIGLYPGSSNPEWFVEVAGVAYFAATNLDTGTELWRTDGTPAGTWLVDDRRPGPESFGPHEPMSAGGLLYFVADDGTGKALWSSDGTATGTVRLIPLAGTDPITSWAALGSRLFVAVSHAALWSSDGTPAGTIRVRDFRAPGVFRPLGEIASADDRLFLSVDDGAVGREPWVSDGTEAGTTLLADLRVGPDDSDPRHLADCGGILYFAADDGVSGIEPWRSDGTPGGTARVADVAPGVRGSGAGWFAVVTAGVIFIADDGSSGKEPWITDGTASGTGRVVEIAPGGAPSDLRLLAAAAGRAYFLTPVPGGQDLWSSDGTALGTIRIDVLSDVLPYPPTADVAGGLYYGRPAGGVRELWFTDGSVAGTAPVPAPAAGALGSLGDRVVFAGDLDTGYEPWVTDGTAAGTRSLHDIAVNTGHSFPRWLTVMDDVVYFAAGQPDRELWRSDGTEAGTWRVLDIMPGGLGSDPEHLVVAGGRLFFTASSPTDWGLWSSDGTAGGTTMVFPEGDRELAVTSDHCWWFRNYDLHPLWRSDGTVVGTHDVAEFPAKPWVPGPSHLTGSGNRVLFTVLGDDTSGREPWVSDGTLSGTHLLRDIHPGTTDSLAHSYTRVGELTYFVAQSPAGSELWRTDGTRPGTELVRDIASSGSSFPQELSDVGALWFSADDGMRGREPWLSDGTETGTRVVADIAPGAASSNPKSFVRAGDRVYFSASDGTTGVELWSLVRDVPTLHDLRPGGDSSHPYGLVAVGAGVVFMAMDDVGYTPWIADRASSPRPVVEPRLRHYANPAGWRMVEAGGRVFFAGDDGPHGDELWVVTPDTDGDSFADPCDTCPAVADPGQEDLDGDGTGDACDDDADGDGVRSEDDCDDRDAALLAAAAEVSGLHLRQAGALVALAWDGQEAAAGPGIRYDVFSGPLGPGAWDRTAPFAAAGCLAGDVAAPALDAPLPGSAWILVRAGLPAPCGDGPLGGPVERESVAAVACP